MGAPLKCGFAYQLYTKLLILQNANFHSVNSTIVRPITQNKNNPIFKVQIYTVLMYYSKCSFCIVAILFPVHVNKQLYVL